MPNSTVPAAATGLPISRRFLLSSLIAAPVALVPTLRTLTTTFDPWAYIAAMRAVGMTVDPCHSLRSYFLGRGTGGFNDRFFAVGEHFADAYKADPHGTEKVYLALCSEEARRG